MSDRVLRTILTANVSGFTSGMAKAAASAKSFAASGTAAVRSFAAGEAAAAKSFGSASVAAIEKNKSSLDGVAKAAALVGGAMALGVGAAVKATAQFDQAMSRVASTGDDARKNIDGLRKAAIAAGTTTSFSATEAADGIESLAKAGVSAQDTLQGGLKGALDLAAAGTISVGDAADVAATALTQFKLQGTDVPHVADLLAAGASKAQGDVGDLGMALKQSGLVAAQFGLSIEDTTGTLAAFASSGLLGSDAGTSFKTMLLRLANPSKEAAAKMRELGVNAYDAQGKFVGITDLANQLSLGLGDLTQSQRDAALSTIFGSDAIRAANVLYQQGGTGIQDWIDKVNDTGYAAKAAGERTDNLLGDLKHFRGALEAAFIGGGSGATDALRDIVKGATDLVNRFNRLPPEVQGSVVKVAAALAGLGLGTAALIKLGQGVASLVISLGKLRAAAAASSTLTTLGGAAGPAAIAVAAVGAAGYGLDALGAKVAPVNQLTDAFKELARTGDSTKLQLDQIGKANFADTLSQAIFTTIPAAKNLSSAISNQSNQLLAANGGGLLGALSKAGLAYEKFHESIIPGKQALEKQQEAVANVDQSLSDLVASGNTKAAAEGFKEITNQAGPIALGTFKSYEDSLRKIASDLGVTQLSSEDLARWMGGEVPASVKAAAAAADQGSPAVAALGASIDTTSDKFAAAGQYFNTATEALQAFFAASAGALNADAALINYKDSVVATTAAIKKNGEAWSVNTEKGKANRRALQGQAQQAQAYISSLVNTGASTGTVVKATQRAHDQFVKNAIAMGRSSDQAEALARRYGLIPKDVNTAITTPGARDSAKLIKDVTAAAGKVPKSKQTSVTVPGAKVSKASTDALIHALDSIPKEKRPQVISAFQRGGIDAAIRALNGIDGKTATTYINTIRTTKEVVKSAGANLGYDLGGGKKSAAGGYISGPGTATSDSIPAWLSNGEFVIRAAAVRAVGLSALHEINAQGYASGGPVAPSTFGASSPGFNVSQIVALIRALDRPVDQIKSAYFAMINATKAAIAAQKATKEPRSALAAATATANKAKAARDKAKAQNDKDYRRDREAEQALERKLRDARTKAGSKISKDERKRIDDLEKRQNKAQDKRQKTYAANQKENEKYDKAYSKAADAKSKAQDKYNAALDKAKDASDKLKDAQAALAQQQQELADSAKQVSASFRDEYVSKTTDVKDWIALMQQGTSDIGAFNAKIKQLRAAGLSETVIQQIVAMGAVGGADVASQIIKGGAALVTSLNKANQGLQDAADQLGFTSASGNVIKKAAGGPVFGPGTGTSDSIRAALSNGEYVINAAATARHRGVLDAINYGRAVIDQRSVPAYRYGGPVRTEAPAAPAGDVINISGNFGYDPDTIARRIQVRKRDALALAGAGRRI